MNQKPYICTRLVEHDGQAYEPPAEILLTDEFAAPLIKVGAIRLPDSIVTEPELELEPEPEKQGNSTSQDSSDQGSSDQGSESSFRYHAEHRGAGRWYVIDETTGEAAEGTKAMKQPEAEALADEMNKAATEQPED